MQTNSSLRILVFIKLPLIIHWITILILTSIPSDSLPTVSLGDKIEHYLAFFVLGFFLYLNFLFKNKYKLLKNYPFIFSLLVASLYGAFDELHQLLIPGRSAEFLDWLADFLGAISGISIAYLIVSLFANSLKKFFKLSLEPLS